MKGTTKLYVAYEVDPTSQPASQQRKLNAKSGSDQFCVLKISFAVCLLWRSKRRTSLYIRST